MRTKKKREYQTFSIPMIGAVLADGEMQEKLQSLANRRSLNAYIRKTIITFAEKEGFNAFIPSAQEFIGPKLWEKITKRQEKSHTVDYTYVIAFYWLFTLDKYIHYSKSELLRKILKENLSTS